MCLLPPSPMLSLTAVHSDRLPWRFFALSSPLAFYAPLVFPPFLVPGRSTSPMRRGTITHFTLTTQGIGSSRNLLCIFYTYPLLTSSAPIYPPLLSFIVESVAEEVAERPGQVAQPDLPALITSRGQGQLGNVAHNMAAITGGDKGLANK